MKTIIAFVFAFAAINSVKTEFTDKDVKDIRDLLAKEIQSMDALTLNVTLMTDFRQLSDLYYQDAINNMKDNDDYVVGLSQNKINSINTIMKTIWDQMSDQENQTIFNDMKSLCVRLGLNVEVIKLTNQSDLHTGTAEELYKSYQINSKRVEDTINTVLKFEEEGKGMNYFLTTLQSSIASVSSQFESDYSSEMSEETKVKALQYLLKEFQILFYVLNVDIPTYTITKH